MLVWHQKGHGYYRKWMAINVAETWKKLNAFAVCEDMSESFPNAVLCHMQAEFLVNTEDRSGERLQPVQTSKVHRC